MFHVLIDVLRKRIAFQSLPTLERYKLMCFSGIVIPYSIALPVILHGAKEAYEQKIGMKIPPGVQWMYMGTIYKFLPKEGDGLDEVKGG